MKQSENWFAKMDEIIANYLSDKRPEGTFATSLDIAKMTGREHRNVLRDIRNIMENMKIAHFSISSILNRLNTWIKKVGRIQHLVWIKIHFYI